VRPMLVTTNVTLPRGADLAESRKKNSRALTRIVVELVAESALLGAIGGLVGLLVLWLSVAAVARAGAPSRVEVLAHVVPRFSNVAFVSVLLLLASGIGATILHIPVLNALWTTSYGVAILVKVGLLMAAMALGAVNLRRTKPRLVAARERSELGEAAARLLRRTVSGETVLLVAAVFAAATLSSFPPPAAALAAGSLTRSTGPTAS